MDEDTRDWLKKSKKRSKLNAQLAKKRAQEQEELDKAALAEDAYSSKDLEGIRVAHGKTAFDDGEEHVLVLKDSNVVDDEDDQLHNVNLAEHERTKERIDLQKRGKTAYEYTGYDDEQFANGGVKPGVLSKYNEEIDGKGAGDGFQLSADNAADDTDDKSRVIAQVPTESARQVQRDMLSLDYLKVFGGSDYKESKPEKAPKLKKRKNTHSSRKTKTLGDDEEDDTMEIDDTKPITGKRKEYEDTAVADDDDLQIALARQRRQKIKQRKANHDNNKIKQEEPDDVMETYDNGIKNEDEDLNEDDGRILINDTAEFVKGIVKPEERKPPPPPKTKSAIEQIKAEPNLPLIPDSSSQDNQIEVDATRDEEKMEDVEDGYGEEPERGNEEEEQVKKEKEDVEDDEEKDENTMTSSSRSLSSTLSVLRRQGLLKAVTSEEREQDQAVQKSEQWKAKWRAEELRRERERLSARESMANLTDEQRREENLRRNRELARKDLDNFKDYKPAIEIKYHDEFGRDLTPMEAWKELSHRFHGKSSGAAKTEKRLRRIEEEKMRERMASGDTPLNTNAAFQARQQKMGSATMVLSIGNKGSAPQDESAYLADTGLDKLQKGSSSNTSKRSKGKGKAKQ